MTAAASRRQLHTELHRLRVAAGLTQTEVARAHEWSPSKVHRIERGQVSVSRPDLLALLSYFGVTDPVIIDHLLQLARLSRNAPMPYAAYRDVFPPEIIRFLGYEASASWIGELELLVVPGLLQIPQYTRALVGGAHGIDPAGVEKFVSSRRERQQILSRSDPPQLSFLLDEAALGRAVGGPDTMRAQLAHLREAAAAPNITIRVLPLALGAHAGLRGPFVHLRFAGINDPDVVYLENRQGDSIFENDDGVTAMYLELFRDLERRAAPPEELDAYVERAIDRLPARSP
jgi:transcriptional regulator with XRE-family HTH domain